MTTSKGSQRRREAWTRLLTGLCVCLAALGLYIWQPALLQQADRLIYDVYVRHNGGGTPSPTPAIVDLDEASLRTHGQWPWPRHMLARLFKRMTEAGAAAIGVDILLAEPDRSSPVHIRKALQQGFGVDIGFSGLPDHLQDNDALLALVLAQTPIVLGMYTQFGQGLSTPLPKDLPRAEGIIERMPPGTPLTAPSLRSQLFKGTGATLPLPILHQLAPLGSLNVAPDPDGIVRSVPLLTEVDGRIIPALPLRTLMRGLGTSTITLEGGPDGLAAIRVGSYSIPVSPQGLFYVPFRGGRGAYPYLSAADILDGKVPDSELQGRVLLLGTSAPGLLDIRATPFDPLFPGVEVQAAVIDAILSKRAILKPAWIPGAQIASVFGVGLVGTLAFGLAPALVYLPLLLALAAGSLWGSWHIFAQGIFISPLYVLLTLTGISISLLAVRFMQESQQRRQLRQAFSRYVAPDMVERIADRGEAVLAGEEREVTLMFTDIRGFTSLSEKLDPAQVVSVLNRYFTPMTAIIRSSGGTVDKFIGDAIMAFWNAPLDVPQHELRAMQAAMDMQAALARLNVALEAEFGITLRMGVGVHTGKVYVGNMGSAELLDYTCIGDTVNLTSRLEGQCPTYGVGVVASMISAERIAAFAAESAPENQKDVSKDVSKGASKDVQQDVPVFVPLDAIRVKGKTQPVEIATPISAAEAATRAEELHAFSAARAAYTAGSFDEAAQAFAALRATFPDTLLYSLYTERSEHLCANPPEDWDGVWTFTKK